MQSQNAKTVKLKVLSTGAFGLKQICHKACFLEQQERDYFLVPKCPKIYLETSHL